MPVTLTEPAPGYPVYVIDHPAATARVALHGAHLMEWTPAGQQPVIYLSPKAIYQEGKAIRGGIPVCWPWFGPAAEAGLPAHGVARSRFWTLDHSSEDAGGVTLVFSLTDSEATRRLWPHGFSLRMEMRIGQRLQLSLRMENTSSTACQVTGALHSYFVIGDIHQTSVSGLNGIEYLDQVDAQNVHRQTGEIHFSGEVDREYLTNQPVVIHDPVLQRTLTIRSAGSGCTVVWNPWIAKSQTMADLPEEAWQKFVCVETANAFSDRISLPPGAVHLLGMEIEVNARV
jgi:glucose-6-phosphate 1-epimerase